jgi:cytochrome b6-f complex iron-sulfur subunit
MNRKDFFARVGFGVATLLVPSCIAGLATSCSKDENVNTAPTQTPNLTPTPTIVDFKLDVSSGELSKNGGYLLSLPNEIVVARTNDGVFLAVSAACTHQSTIVNYVASNNSFNCQGHGSNFDSTGRVTNGPATTNLKQYKTELTGTSLRVFS